MREYRNESGDGSRFKPLRDHTRLTNAGHASLDGYRSGLFKLAPFFGPAFVASVAYIDPGNFATNIQAGSQFGYRLLWAIVMANLVAMLIQTLSAKLGIASGRN